MRQVIKKRYTKPESMELEAVFSDAVSYYFWYTNDAL